MRSKDFFRIENVIRMPDGQFIALKKAINVIPKTLFEDTENSCDPLGIYKIILGHEVFMDESFFDSIIFMWAYFINAVEEFINEGFAELWFFDQPILLTIKSEGSQRVKLILDWRIEPVRTIVVSRTLFLKEFVRAGIEFYEIWREYDQASTDRMVSMYIDRIQEIEKKSNLD